jgi:hypothetical protein
MGASLCASQHIGGRDFGFDKARATFRTLHRIGVYFGPAIGTGKRELFATLRALQIIGL